MNPPSTIQVILGALGHRSINGSIAYVGGHQPIYSHPPHSRDVECRPSQPSSVTPEGLISNEVGLTFSVNGKKRENWKFSIAYEPDDTFTVRLWKSVRRNPRNLEELRRSLEDTRVGEVIAERKDVYVAELGRVVEHMYDTAIKERCDGFIPC